jgi:hypothetical protein
MLHHLRDSLKRTALKYHKLVSYSDKRIILKGTSQKSQRVEEVMRIKQLADRHSLFTKWDGNDIQILRV